MALRFAHFLCLLTIATLLSCCVALTNVLHTAILQSGFSVQILRPVGGGSMWDHDWEPLLDFLSQMPAKKLAYIFLTHSPSHILLIILMSTNVMLLVGWLLHGLIFAWNVTSAELKVARDHSLNFAIFRLIFLGSILETGTHPALQDAAAKAGEQHAASAATALAPGSGSLRELACWLAFFGLIGFLRWFLVLLRERFQTAQASPYATVHTFVKYLCVTLAFTVLNLVVAACIVIGLRSAGASWTIMSLLVFENLILMASCAKIVFRYALYIQTLRREQPWEERGSALYYSDMLCEMFVSSLTLAHLVHIWLHYGLSFSLIDMFLFLHVRQLVVGLWRNIIAVRNYSRALWELNARFPDATPAELERLNDDVCSICRDSMERAKKLPCGHCFHKTCIQQWIEHASFCPTCRGPLLPRGAPPNAAGGPIPPAQQRPAGAAGGAAAVGGAAGGGAGLLDAQQLALAQLRQMNQGPAAGIAGGQAPANRGYEGYPGNYSQSIHAVGLRHRPRAAAGSGAYAAASPSSILGMQPPPADRGFSVQPGAAAVASPGSAVAAGAANAGAAGGPAVQQLFRFDSRNVSSWLPQFQFEVQSIHEQMQPQQQQQQQQQQQPPPQPSALALQNVPVGSGTDEEAYRAALIQYELDRAAAIENEAAAAATASAASSSAAIVDGEAKETGASSAPASASSSSAPLSLRDRIYLATQRRLEGEQAASRDATPSATTSPSHAASEAAASSPASSSSAVAASSMLPPSTPASSSMHRLPSVTASPPLLSQAEADANLARQLQHEEDLLAAEERQRRNGASTFANFFRAL